jgi:hypothetical protein
MALGGPQPPRLPVPWKPEQLIRLLATDLLALALLVIAWFNSAGELHLATQIRYVDLAVLAAVLAGIGHTSWIVAGRRAVGLRTRELAEQVQQRCRVGASAASQAPTLTAFGAITGYVQAAGMTKVHVPECPLIKGKPMVVVAADAGLPCGVCR